MRKDEDILKSFERRVRMNEIAARRIHDLINKIRSRERFDIVESRKSRFDDRQKFEYQNDNIRSSKSHWLNSKHRPSRKSSEKTDKDLNER